MKAVKEKIMIVFYMEKPVVLNVMTVLDQKKEKTKPTNVVSKMGKI